MNKSDSSWCANCLSLKQAFLGLALTVCGVTYWVYAFKLATPSVTSFDDEQCPDVLASMTQGRWERLPMTSSQAAMMNAFHKHVREKIQKMAPGLQRKDGLCGNVGFKKVKSRDQWNFRAMCDVDGKTPCCYKNRCVNRSVADCQCPECVDMRNPLHAEFARWVPYDRQCQVTDMKTEEICRVLNGSTLLFVGDSFVRHVYTAMLLLATGNNVTGAFRRDIPEGLRTTCAGIYIFTEKVCRMWVDFNRTVCPGNRTHLRFYNHFLNQDVQQVVSPLYGKPRSLVLFGLGGHGKMKAWETFGVVLQPVLNTMKKRKLARPRVVWAPIHHWGKLKTRYRDKVEEVLRFNQEMKRRLRPFPVGVLSSFNMTSSGVESFDGAHYGWGVNRMKALILLHHIKQLQTQGLWG